MERIKDLSFSFEESSRSEASMRRRLSSAGTWRIYNIAFFISFSVFFRSWKKVPKSVQNRSKNWSKMTPESIKKEEKTKNAKPCFCNTLQWKSMILHLRVVQKRVKKHQHFWCKKSSQNDSKIGPKMVKKLLDNCSINKHKKTN